MNGIDLSNLRLGEQDNGRIFQMVRIDGEDFRVLDGAARPDDTRLPVERGMVGRLMMTRPPI
jgi:hypothetical protein